MRSPLPDTRRVSISCFFRRSTAISMNGEGFIALFALLHLRVVSLLRNLFIHDCSARRCLTGVSSLCVLRTRRRKENKSARMKCETLCGVSDANTEHSNNKLMHQQRFCFDLLVWPLWNAVGKKQILFSVLLCYRQVFWFTYPKSFCSRV